MKTINSREFNQDISGAKRAAKEGPVVITDRGQPAYVLLDIEAYRSLTGSHVKLGDAFSKLSAGDSHDHVEFPRLFGSTPAPIDFED